MDYILVAGAIYLAFKAGYWFHRYYFAWIISEHPELLEKLLEVVKTGKMDPTEFTNVIKSKHDIKTESKEEGTELVVERHGGMLYAFAKDTDQFIAQGSSLHILLEEAAKRFPGRKFFGEIAKENPAKELV